MSGLDIFGVHEKALALREYRGSILAGNLVNISTPQYKARDFNFSTALKNANGSSDTVTLETSNPKHITGEALTSDPKLLYRIPAQASLDGNTVDSDMEQAAFTDNALRYETTLSFIKGHYRTLLSAIQVQE